MDGEIVRNRTAQAKLTVLGAGGKPLANREVCVKQTRHKFLFGTAAFDTVPLANGEYQGERLAAAEQRAEKLCALFNAATLPFYWSRFEPQRGKPMTQELRNAARWCAEHGLRIKGTRSAGIR